jgi:hypothetical protein
MDQNPKFFLFCVEEGCSASLCMAHEKKLEILSITGGPKLKTV